MVRFPQGRPVWRKQRAVRLQPRRCGLGFEAWAQGLAPQQIPGLAVPPSHALSFRDWGPTGSGTLSGVCPPGTPGLVTPSTSATKW